MHVLILHNATVLSEEDPTWYSDYQIVDTACAVQEVLEKAGCQVRRLALGRDHSLLLLELTRERTDVVFNLFEGLADDPCSEWRVAALLESMSAPFTGCPAGALRNAGSKHVAKRRMRAAGLPTPQFHVRGKFSSRPWPYAWPVIVKPARYDASLGISQGSVVENQADLERQVRVVLDELGPPVLIEEFVWGREITITVIEDDELYCLPGREILFPPDAGLRWPILTFHAKWYPESAEYLGTPVSYPAQLEPALASRLNHLACLAFHAFGCRDIARVDFRITPAGKPYVLEVNPNPDLNPNSGLYLSMSAGHLDYDQLIPRMVRRALARAGDTDGAHHRVRGAYVD